MARIRVWEGTRVVVGGDEEGQGQARQREGVCCCVQGDGRCVGGRGGRVERCLVCGRRVREFVSSDELVRLPPTPLIKHIHRRAHAASDRLDRVQPSGRHKQSVALAHLKRAYRRLSKVGLDMNHL